MRDREICVNENDLIEAILEATIKRTQVQYDIFNEPIEQEYTVKKRDRRIDAQKVADREERLRKRRAAKEKEIEDKFKETGRPQLELAFESKIKRMVMESVKRYLRNL
jgi:hypothetical protein